jgi:copper chaperone
MEPFMTDLTLKITGMSCGGCVRSVTGVLKALPGVASVDVSLEQGEARVSFDAAQVTPAQLSAAIEDAGFEVAA